MSISDRLRRNVPAVVDDQKVVVPEVCTPEEVIRAAGGNPLRRDLARETPDGFVEVIPKGKKIEIVGPARFYLQVINEGG